MLVDMILKSISILLILKKYNKRYENEEVYKVKLKEVI